MSVICPYCDCEAALVDSSVVYGKSYGWMYLCEPCGAYVGCHRGTTNPLGTPASEQLRHARRSAHTIFDPLWKDGVFKSRKNAYRWLADELDLTFDKCHIAMFDIEQCRKAVAACKAKLLEARRRS